MVTIHPGVWSRPTWFIRPTCQINRHTSYAYGKHKLSIALLVYFRRIENIGHVQQAVFDIAPKSGKQIIAASKENVIAGLSLSTGKISK